MQHCRYTSVSLHLLVANYRVVLPNLHQARFIASEKHITQWREAQS